MTEPVPAPSQSVGASLGVIVIGLLVGCIGFLAATADGMATAPTRWSGLAPMAFMAVGLVLALLGLASLLMPNLRPAARRSAILVVVVLAVLYLLSRFLMIAGFSNA